MQIRALKDEDLKDIQYLLSQAFSFGTRSLGDWGKIDEQRSTSFGIFDEAGLQAGLEINHYKIYMGSDLVIKMGGIGGVACLPASRGKGYAGEALKHALKLMKEYGEYTSFLFPFSWEFYQKYGWEWTGLQRTYSVPTKVLKSTPETDYVRAGIEIDRKNIEGVYEQYSKSYRGMMVREERMWDDILNHEEKTHTFNYVYVRDGIIEGYIILRGGKKEETRIREFITLTSRAQQGLLGLMRRHEMQIDKFVWAVPEEDALWSQIYHWDIETKLEPAASARVVDVVGALTAWKPVSPFHGQFVMAVQDKYAPWNEASWKVEIEDSGVKVSQTNDSVDLSLDIQALSQLYFGSPNIIHLRHAGRVTVHNEAAFHFVQQFFDGPTMWINNHF